MKQRVFEIRADEEHAKNDHAALNSFLNSVLILGITSSFIDVTAFIDEGGKYWSIAIEYDDR